MKHHIVRVLRGWLVYTTVPVAGRGVRQVGGEAIGFMDDHGNLCFDRAGVL